MDSMNAAVLAVAQCFDFMLTWEPTLVGPYTNVMMSVYDHNKVFHTDQRNPNLYRHPLEVNRGALASHGWMEIGNIQLECDGQDVHLWIKPKV